MKFLNKVDFGKNQIINVVLENAAAHPAAPKAGSFYYNTTEKVIYYYDGTVWVSLNNIGAGDGLVETIVGGVKTLNVNVDNSTIEVVGDVVRLKDQGVSTAKLKDNNVTTIKILDKNITFAKMQDMVAMTVLGAITAGRPQEIPILNEADFLSNSPSALASQQSIKTYVDSRVASLGNLIGPFDAAAATNLPGSGTTKKGDYWYATTAGTVQGIVFNIGDVIHANQAAPTVTNANHYFVLESNRSQATTTELGVIKLATTAMVDADVMTDGVTAVTPQLLERIQAKETKKGIAAIATQAEAIAGTNDTKMITPLKLKAVLDLKSGGMVANIGNGAAVSFDITHTLGTEDLQVQVKEIATGEYVYPNIKTDTAAKVNIQFGADNVPTAAQYRVVIHRVG
jgi:hypothetical protein